MLQQSQSAQSQTRPSVAVTPEALKTLTEKAQEFTQALLDLSQETQSDSPAQDPSKKPKEPDQIRCYRLPGFIVREERETLEEHQVEDLLRLLEKAREDFYITSFLLRNFNDAEDVNGYTLQQIGEHLNRPIRMLTRLCSIFADFKPYLPEQNPDC